MTSGTDTLEIAPLPEPVTVTVSVPGSKSYTNRALVLAALAEGRSILAGALFSDDTARMADSLEDLGFGVDRDEDGETFAVRGAAGSVPADRASVFIGNAGTAARFLPPVMALGKGEYELDGIPRMRERPIAPLLAALRSLGVKVETLGRPDCVPIRVLGGSLPLPGPADVTLPASTSSQFVTGLLLAAPHLGRGTTIRAEGDLVSRPYLDMTIRAMGEFGVAVEVGDHHTFHVPAGSTYRATHYRVEPDASAASYFFAAAAITRSTVTVEGLGQGSLQGDLRFVEVLGRMGADVVVGSDRTTVTGPAELRGVDVDMRDLSDTAQTLAVVAPFAHGPTTITGIGFIRRKETDRVGALVAELRRLGIDAGEEPDGLRIHPGTPSPATVETYDDHRMAMSFALVGLRVPGIKIRDPACTAKTFPRFWEVLDGLRCAAE